MCTCVETFFVRKSVISVKPEANVSDCRQVGSRGIEAAWAGGRNGREVMDRFFPLAPELLSPRGLFYLVTVKENNPGN
jgi:release factor glutamine methyltransferase